MKDVPFPDDTLTLLSFNIRSFSANFQGLLDQCLNERMCMYFDIMAFSGDTIRQSYNFPVSASSI